MRNEVLSKPQGAQSNLLQGQRWHDDQVRAFLESLLEVSRSYAQGAPAGDVRAEHAPAQRQETKPAVHADQGRVREILPGNRLPGETRTGAGQPHNRPQRLERRVPYLEPEGADSRGEQCPGWGQPDEGGTWSRTGRATCRRRNATPRFRDERTLLNNLHLQTGPLYANRHHERGWLLLHALIVIDTKPGSRATDIAWSAAPEESARRAAIHPRLVGLWYSGRLEKWRKAGFIFRRFPPRKRNQPIKREMPMFYLTNKGIEVLLALGVKRERIEA